MVFFLGPSATESMVDIEQAGRGPFYWRSKDSEYWDRNSRSNRGRIAIDGS